MNAKIQYGEEILIENINNSWDKRIFVTYTHSGVLCVINGDEDLFDGSKDYVVTEWTNYKKIEHEYQWIYDDGSHFAMTSKWYTSEKSFRAFNQNLHIVSPERYAGMPETKITSQNLVGTWETIRLTEIYDSVVLWQGQIPGGGWKYSTSMFNNSEILEFLEGGEIRDQPDLLWTYRSNQVILESISGEDPVSLMVINAWDWENSCPTIAFTGLSPDGFGFWGKKVVSE